MITSREEGREDPSRGELHRLDDRSKKKKKGREESVRWGEGRGRKEVCFVVSVEGAGRQRSLPNRSKNEGARREDLTFFSLSFSSLSLLASYLTASSVSVFLSFFLACLKRDAIARRVLLENDVEEWRRWRGWKPRARLFIVVLFFSWRPRPVVADVLRFNSSWVDVIISKLMNVGFECEERNVTNINCIYIVTFVCLNIC